MHYSQQPSTVSFEQVHRTVASGVTGKIVHARLQGFITAPVLDDALNQLDRRLQGVSFEAQAIGGDGAAASPLPSAPDEGDALAAVLLCDVSEVSGYGADTTLLARRWLKRAERRGMRKIAFVAHSSVLRTTVELLRDRTSVDLGCFPSEASARAWLDRG